MAENKEDLAKQFRKTTDELTQLIEKFDHETFNHKPSADKWSAGEVAEHLLIFDIRLNLILEGATHSTERDINEQVPIFTARVSNRANKIDAPDFLLPSGGIKSPTALVEKIRNERRKIFKAIEEQELSLHNKHIPHRFFGEMTANEWIKLVDVHANRHIEQLKELLAKTK